MTLPVSAVRDLLCWQGSQPLASPLFILWKQNNDSSIIHGQKGIQLEATSVAAAMGGWSSAEWKWKYSFCFKKTRNTLQKLYLIFWSKFFELLLTKWTKAEDYLKRSWIPCSLLPFLPPFSVKEELLEASKRRGVASNLLNLYIFLKLTSSKLFKLKERLSISIFLKTSNFPGWQKKK